MADNPFTDSETVQLTASLKPLLEQLDQTKSLIDSYRPLQTEAIDKLFESFKTDFIYHSNAIEGNTLTRQETLDIIEKYASEEELSLSRALTIDGKSVREHLEVIGLRGALDLLLDIVRRQTPLTEENLLEVHNLVYRNIDRADAGRYRRNAVRITGTEYQPPEPVLIPDHMARFLTWINQANETHPVVKAALAQWWMASIHPFRDGNGRVARLVMNFVLLRDGYPFTILIAQERAQYYDALAAADGGNRLHFCDFIASSALRTARSFETGLAEQRRADDLLGAAVQKVLDKAKSDRLQYYELWKIQMERIRKSFKSVSLELTARLGKSYSIDFLEYSLLGFDQFETLLERRNPGEQWFFKVKIRPFAGTPTEYVFWFGWAGELVRNYTG